MIWIGLGTGRKTQLSNAQWLQKMFCRSHLIWVGKKYEDSPERNYREISSHGGEAAVRSQVTEPGRADSAALLPGSFNSTAVTRESFKESPYIDIYK